MFPSQSDGPTSRMAGYGGSTDERNQPQACHELATSVDDIRAILTAAVRQLGVEVPQKTSNTINTGALIPTASLYDETAVVNYHFADLPPFLKVQQVTKDYYSRRYDKPFPSGWLVDKESKQPHDSSPGHQHTFEWNLPDIHPARSFMAHLLSKPTQMRELGFERDGYVRTMRACEYPKLVENIVGTAFHLAIPSSSSVFNAIRFRSNKGQFINAEGAVTEAPWIEQRFGKEWFISCRRALNRTKLEIFAAQASAEIPHSYGSFLRQFTQDWKSSLERRIWPSMNGCMLEYHMRFLTTESALSFLPEDEQDPDDRNTILERVSGLLPAPRYKSAMDVSERRVSLALITTTHMDLPIFKLIGLSDCAFDSLGDSRGWASQAKHQDSLNWKSAGILPLLRGTGIAAFAFRIHSSCDLWASEWNRFLDSIDQPSEFDLAGILSHEQRLEMMFDDAGSEFALSEFYFTVLQLLRIAHDWIQESVENLKDLIRSLEKDYEPSGRLGSIDSTSSEIDQAAAEVSRRNWESVTSHQQQLANSLLTRIARKREEVSSLRDGLFNATSVREATKSTQLNHYILVFTVVTIFYLPLSFIAALFALGLFSWDNPGQKKSFIATIIAVAIATYVFSAVLIWPVRKPKRREIFKKLWVWSTKD